MAAPFDLFALPKPAMHTVLDALDRATAVLCFCSKR